MSINNYLLFHLIKTPPAAINKSKLHLQHKEKTIKNKNRLKTPLPSYMKTIYRKWSQPLNTDGNWVTRFTVKMVLHVSFCWISAASGCLLCLTDLPPANQTTN